MKKDMKYRYDRESDVLLITLGRGKPDFAEQKENVIAHYKKDGTPLEIEILDASEMAWEILKTLLPKKRATA